MPITHISYAIFEQIMRYLYSGEFDFREGDEDNIETIIDILRVADEEFLDDVSSISTHINSDAGRSSRVGLWKLSQIN